VSHKELTALILGSDGEIGSALAHALKQSGASVITTSKTLDPNNPNLKRLDLEHPQRFQLSQKVDVAYLCAGMTKLAECQAQPGLSWEVNVKSQIRLIRELYAQGTFIVYFSSHLIFDGTFAHVKPDNRQRPHCRFAEQKVAVEEHLSKLDSGYSVIRLSNALGPRTPLLCQWASALQNGESIDAVNDMFIAPVATDQIVRAAILIGQERKEGVFQLSGDKDVPFDRVAVELAEQLGVSSSLVRSVSADDANWDIVARPENTTLDTSRARRELDFRPLAWSEVLGHFVEANRLRSEQPYSSIADED
jgi:dTDP-4-dehydrorhamnose reductase